MHSVDCIGWLWLPYFACVQMLFICDELLSVPIGKRFLMMWLEFSKRWVTEAPSRSELSNLGFCCPHCSAAWLSLIALQDTNSQRLNSHHFRINCCGLFAQALGTNNQCNWVNKTWFLPSCKWQRGVQVRTKWTTGNTYKCGCRPSKIYW